MQDLTILSIEKNQISDLSSLRGKQRLVLFEAANNRITDRPPFAGLSEVQVLTLDNNQITSIAALANNPGLQRGSLVFIANNPLDPDTITLHITTLQDRNVTLQF